MADVPFAERLAAACRAAELELGEIAFDPALIDASQTALETLADADLGAAIAEIVIARRVEEHDPAALAWFERRYIAPLGGVLARFALDPGVLDEVKQRVRTKLLVAEPGARPRIVEYAGRGRLAALVGVAATREALDWLRRHRREQPELDSERAGAGDPFDPGQVMDREQTRRAFRDAFQGAAGELTSRDRTLLRLHLLGQVTLEQLALMYGVHRATVVRWLAAAREQVREATERRLREALGVRSDELESLLRLAQSRLDVSVGRVLASDEHD